MEKYSLYCSEEQTKKAFKLGAPIKTRSYRFDDHSKSFFAEEGIGYFIPTAEQMIGWLMEMLKITTWYINYFPVVAEYGYIIICEGVVIEYSINEMSENPFKSYKEATLAAISAALEYLSNNRK